ncbi:MAG: ABC transporter substrate-binding protein [Planctomycetota bacterium]
MAACPICGKIHAEGPCPRGAPTSEATILAKDPLVGSVLNGTYRIDEAIGAGGMGAVYRATQLALSRNVALKVLLPNLAVASDFRARFLREAKLLSHLAHPNIVSVIDFGQTEAGLLYLVMEHLTGATLAERVPIGKGLPLEVVVPYMREMCDAIGAAHAQGLVHRDLKPANVFLTRVTATRDLVKVLDFGLGKEGGENDRLTATGIAMGTPGYISTEQIHNSADADARSDVYALGAILHFMLSGRDPYDGESATAVMMKQLQGPPVPIDYAAKGLPPALGDVIAGAMQRDRTQRFASTAQLMAALNAAVAGAPAPPSPSSPTVPAAPPAQPAQPTPTPPVPTTTDPGRPGRGVFIAIAAVVLAIGVFGVVQWTGKTHSMPPPGPEPPAQPSEPSRRARGVTDTEVFLGMCAPFSGPSKELGREMQRGIRCALSDLNEGGGVHGRLIELVSVDDGYEPERAEKAARELLGEKKVFALIGNVGTPTTAAVLPIALEDKTILFGAMTGAGMLRNDPPDRYVFNVRASYAEETASMVRHFLGPMSLPPEAIAVFAQEDSYGESGFQGVEKQLRIAGYHGEVLRVGYKRNTDDVEAAVAAILDRRDRVKAVAMVGVYRPCAKFIRLLKDAKLEAAFANVSFVGSRALSDELMSMGAKYAEGVIVTQVVPHFDSDLPAAKAYRESMKRHFSDEAPSFVGFEGYLAATVFAEALRRVGRDLDTESLADALEKIQSYDSGIGAPLSFGPSDHQGLHRVWGSRIGSDGRFQEFALEK